MVDLKFIVEGIYGTEKETHIMYNVK